MLSEDDRNLKEMTDEELALAWDLWFELAQSTNDADPPYMHGVFAGMPRAGHERDDPAPAAVDHPAPPRGSAAVSVPRE
jgi:hypothetical protein